jgi:hypothetical protein
MVFDSEQESCLFPPMACNLLPDAGMEPVVGIFPDRARTEAAVRRLREAGFPESRIEMLLPGDAARTEALVETDDAEQPGVGRAVGGVVGGAVGATTGLGLAATAASLLIPGIGPVTAVGLAAAALFGAAGAVGGAAAGGALEEHSQHGLPHDELYLYRDALMHGKGVVFLLPENDREEKAARSALEAAGAESLDAARHAWWIGIRDAERAHYEGAGGDFEAHEDFYRRGYVAGLHPRRASLAYPDALSDLKASAGDAAHHDAFRSGYERAQSTAVGAPAAMGREPEVVGRKP